MYGTLVILIKNRGEIRVVFHIINMVLLIKDLWEEMDEYVYAMIILFLLSFLSPLLYVFFYFL